MNESEDACRKTNLQSSSFLCTFERQMYNPLARLNQVTHMLWTRKYWNFSSSINTQETDSGHDHHEPFLTTNSKKTKSDNARFTLGHMEFISDKPTAQSTYFDTWNDESNYLEFGRPGTSECSTLIRYWYATVLPLVMHQRNPYHHKSNKMWRSKHRVAVFYLWLHLCTGVVLQLYTAYRDKQSSYLSFTCRW